MEKDTPPRSPSQRLAGLEPLDPDETGRRALRERLIAVSDLAATLTAQALAESEEDEMPPLVARLAERDTSPWCLWCGVMYNKDDYPPMFHADEPWCMGPCRKCRDTKQPTECKRCGATGVRFLDDA